MMERNFIKAMNVLILVAFLTGYFATSMSAQLYTSLISLCGVLMIVVAIWSTIWLVKNPIKKNAWDAKKVVYQTEDKK